MVRRIDIVPLLISKVVIERDEDGWDSWDEDEEVSLSTISAISNGIDLLLETLSARWSGVSTH